MTTQSGRPVPYSLTAQAEGALNGVPYSLTAQAEAELPVPYWPTAKPAPAGATRYWPTAKAAAELSEHELELNAPS